MRGRGNSFSGGGVVAAGTMECAMVSSEKQASGYGKQVASALQHLRWVAAINNQLAVKVTVAAVGLYINIFSEANRLSDRSSKVAADWQRLQPANCTGGRWQQ